MQNICNYQYENDLENYQEHQKKKNLDALCRFLESGLANAQWIDSQLQWYRKWEEDGAALLERERNREIALRCAVYNAIAHRLDDEVIAVGADLSKLWWFFPQGWLSCALTFHKDMKELKTVRSLDGTPSNKEQMNSGTNSIRHQMPRQGGAGPGDLRKSAFGSKTHLAADWRISRYPVLPSC